MPGAEVAINHLSKSFGSSNIWADVTMTLPPGEISVLLGPSGTGKSVPPAVVRPRAIRFTSVTSSARTPCLRPSA